MYWSYIYIYMTMYIWLYGTMRHCNCACLAFTCATLQNTQGVVNTLSGKGIASQKLFPVPDDQKLSALQRWGRKQHTSFAGYESAAASTTASAAAASACSSASLATCNSITSSQHVQRVLSLSSPVVIVSLCPGVASCGESLHAAVYKCLHNNNNNNSNNIQGIMVVKATPFNTQVGPIFYPNFLLSYRASKLQHVLPLVVWTSNWASEPCLSRVLLT